MQGQLWSEVVRTASRLDFMIFPRVLALAERAWHRAEWEGLTKPNERQKLSNEDWTLFANTLGYKELRRLDELGIHYRVPPPGARYGIKPEDQCIIPASNRSAFLHTHYVNLGFYPWIGHVILPKFLFK